MTITPLPPHETIHMLANADVPQRCLYLVAELGIADALDEAADAVTLAQRCSLDAGALDRVLRVVVAHGVFERRGDAYAHNDASRLLRTDRPRSMRPFVRMVGMPVFHKAYGALEHSLRTGETAIEQVTPGGLWPYLRSHPHEAALFNDAMEGKAHGDVADVLAAYDFTPYSSVADIGGGHGHLLRAVLDTAPLARGVLFDLPDVVASLPQPGERMVHQAGDFFADALPAAQLYVLMDVLHDWPDAQAAEILRALRRAAAAGSTALVVEGIRDDDRDDPRAATLDVVMLAVTGGRERTARELTDLMAAAGFRVTALIDTGGPMRLLEAVAV